MTCCSSVLCVCSRMAASLLGNSLLGISMLGIMFLIDLPQAQAQQNENQIAAKGNQNNQIRFVPDSGPDWKRLTRKDFVDVNSAKDTWTFKEDVIYCTGKPVSVIRTQKQYTNFELVCQWRHMKKAGNSGIFLWTIPESLERLKGPGLPQGVEVQVLDLGYKEAYEQGGKRKADWFTCHGDVFPVGPVKFKPFPPVAPNGKRSFPSKELSKGVGQWNHYYVRAINGEVRLWVNGEEVSGGTDISPRSGFVCLESEGSPVEFRNLKIRILP